jgi:hypothetical protein
MMPKLRSIFLLLVSLALSIMTVSAQVPAAVQTALDDLNRQTGQNYTLGAIAYRWDQQIFDGNNLGCPNVANTASGTYRAYIIEFDLNFDGVFEWDYRVSEDGSLLILCKRPSEPVPTSQPQPTLPGPTPSSCTSLLPRLSIGVQGRVLPTDPNIMRELPGTSAAYVSEIPVGGTFTVLDGPRCSGEFTWWQVNYNGMTGWTVESDGSEYWLEVFDPNAPAPTEEADEPVICDPALPPRLQKFEIARVTEGDPNNVRREPVRNAEKVGELPGGSEFRVLDGPRCADGLTWWNVQSIEDSNVTGWTVEGMDGDYFLEPPLPRTPITKDTIQNLSLIEMWDAPHTLIKVLPVSRTTMFVLDDQGYRQVEEQNPFDTTAEFQEILPLDGNVLADVASRDGFPILAQINTDDVTVFVPFTEGGSGIPVQNVVTARFNQDGTRLVTVTDNGEVGIYNLEDITRTTQITEMPFANASSAIFARDDSMVIVAQTNAIDVYDVSSGQPVGAFSFENDLYNQRLSVSPDGRWLATVGTLTEAADSGFAYRLFDLENRTLVWGGLGEGVEYLSTPVFTPDSAMFVMTDQQGENAMLRVFDVVSGDILTGYPLEFAGEIVFDPSGTQLAIVGQNGDQVQFWGVSEQ